MIKKILATILFICFFSLNSNAEIDKIEIKDPWIRKPLGSSKISGAYMEIVNNNNFPIEIISFTTDIAEISEIHDMTHDNGIMRMRRVDSLIIEKNNNVILSPQGKHIMLINLTTKLSNKEKIPMKILIKNHPPIKIQALVKTN